MGFADMSNVKVKRFANKPSVEFDSEVSEGMKNLFREVGRDLAVIVVRDYN
ncbi:MAG: hypothetical protein ACREBF_04710 [Candidatus Micrarchaeales archaeon]